MPWKPPVIWPHQTVVVLGGGPSLNDVSHDLWRGRYRSIGINAAYRLLPDVLFFQDGDFWYRQGHGAEVRRGFSGLVCTIAPQLRGQPRCHVLDRHRNRHKFGLPSADGTLPQITNAGHGAICLAYLFGASRIVLLGFDGCANGNWYSGNPDPADEKRFASRFRPGIESTLEPLREASVELVNATPGSVLDLPTTTPEEALT